MTAPPPARAPSTRHVDAPVPRDTSTAQPMSATYGAQAVKLHVTSHPRALLATRAARHND
eukprot:5213928-Pleurochrysis_carterae.AAC.1